AADGERIAGVGMQHRAVLDIAVLANDDGIVVGPDHHVEPDAGVRVQHHRADQGGVVGNEVRAADTLHLAVFEPVEHDASPLPCQRRMRLTTALAVSTVSPSASMVPRVNTSEPVRRITSPRPISRAPGRAAAMNSLLQLTVTTRSSVPATAATHRV